MTETTPTCLWNDSAIQDELQYSIDHGAVGATCNPVIVVDLLKQEFSLWKDRIAKLVETRPSASEREIAWSLVGDISTTRAAMLRHIFDAHCGRNGRLSIQTDPVLYRNTEALLAQAARFHALAPNMIVKIPVTQAGLAAFEEATYRGITVNATVCFTLPQCVAVAEAVERGLNRRAQAGLDISTMGAVCTIMVGRLDDWLKIQAAANAVVIEPEYLEWAGIAVFKKTYALFQERGYRTRLLCAAFRNHLHLSELIGGDIVLSPPCKWQKSFNRSATPIQIRMATPVDERIVHQLARHFPDFLRASNEDGLTANDFDSFPPTVRTLRQFIEACHELESNIRDLMLPNPDSR